MQAQGWTPPCPSEETLHALSSQEGILLPDSPQAAPRQDLLSGSLGGEPFLQSCCCCRAPHLPMDTAVCVHRLL